MKKLICMMFILMCVTGSLYSILLPQPMPEAEAPDARLFAMGGASTAAAEGVDAIRSNPAALGYLRRSHFKTGLSSFIDVNSKIDDPDIYDYRYDSSLGFDIGRLQWNGSEVYFDENGNSIQDMGENPVDLGSYGFADSPGGIEDMDIWYKKLLPTVSLLNQGLDAFGILPSVSYARPNYGAAGIAEVNISPTVVEYQGSDYLDYGFEFSVESGLLMGAGFDLGPVAVGANLKYYRKAAVLFGFPNDSFLDFEDYALGLVPGAADLEDALSTILSFDSTLLESGVENYLEVGIGAILPLGSFTIGGYIDSILGIVLDDHGSIRKDIREVAGDALLKADIGISFDPARRRTACREPFFNLLLNADLRNIGDDFNRYFSLGGEVGIHFGSLFQVDIRGGYRQKLTGPIYTIMNSDILRIDDGEISFGFGAKVLLFDFNVAASAPAGLILDVVRYEIDGWGAFDPDEYLARYGSDFFRMMVSFGIDI